MMFSVYLFVYIYLIYNNIIRRNGKFILYDSPSTISLLTNRLLHLNFLQFTKLNVLII